MGDLVSKLLLGASLKLVAILETYAGIAFAVCWVMFKWVGHVAGIVAVIGIYAI